MKPMLAHRYQEQRKKIRYPCFVQPKLNGIRALYRGGTFQSRDQHIWDPSVVQHLLYHLLPTIPSDITLDGEFYKHGLSLQRINGAIAVNRNAPIDVTSTIEYHVFDAVFEENLDMPFVARSARLLELSNQFPTSCPVKFVFTAIANNEVEGDQFFNSFKAQSYEGMMYRDAEAPYGLSTRCGNIENRWSCLLKRKDFIDDWFDVVDFNEGEGKYEGMVGSLVCIMPNGLRFNAGSGLSDMERSSFMDRPPSRAKITYEMLSDEGVPLKPSIIETA